MQIVPRGPGEEALAARGGACMSLSRLSGAAGLRCSWQDEEAVHTGCDAATVSI